MEMEKGYDMMIGDCGGCLFGGQCQCVSIVCVILKNFFIFILDEVILVFDIEFECLVQEVLECLMKLCIIIVIVYRLSIIKNVDEICVFYEGDIVERGIYDELIVLNGYYKKLNDMQFL